MVILPSILLSGSVDFSPTLLREWNDSDTLGLSFVRVGKQYSINKQTNKKTVIEVFVFTVSNYISKEKVWVGSYSLFHGDQPWDLKW